MYRLPTSNTPLDFPNDFKTSPEGLLAMDGNLLPETLINAYAKGIFPWFNEGDPLLWWHPDPRLVLFFDQIHVSQSLQKLIKKTVFLQEDTDEKYKYHVTINQDFGTVIEACASMRAEGRETTWITKSMKKAYGQLHNLGFAHSVEVWNPEKELVGGMYGIAIGKVFFGESMFSRENNTSKLAFYWLSTFLKKHGFLLLDCQVESAHLKGLGAKNISRIEFLECLKRGKTHLKKTSAAFRCHSRGGGNPEK
jgi:leucyl/phenylalanyl-tRNA---protein transferase